MSDFLSHFPGISGLVCALLGAGGVGLAMFLINRKWAPLEKQHMDELRLAQGEAVGTLKEAVAEERAQKTDYRNRLHACRNKCQEQELHIAELEARPDFRQLGEVLKGISDRLVRHDESMDKRLEKFSEPIVKMCEKVVKTVEQIIIVNGLGGKKHKSK